MGDVIAITGHQSQPLSIPSHLGLQNASVFVTGFTIISIKIVEKVGGLNGSKICMQIVVVRRITILLLRFFLPLSCFSDSLQDGREIYKSVVDL